MAISGRMAPPEAEPYTVLGYWDPESESFVVEVAEIPGCMSQGDTWDEALANIAEALADCIAALRQERLPVPPPRHYQFGSVAAPSLHE